jgi:hypothetical protein
MLITKYDDGSQSENYQNGDLVMITQKQHSGLGAEVGEWGEVVLNDKKDRDQGHASIISHVTLRTAGVSTPLESFQRCISSMYVGHLKPLPLDMLQALNDAKKHNNCNNMTPSVYKVTLDGQVEYGFNFQPVTKNIGDCFHYDHGAGIHKNQDGEIVWLKDKTPTT